MDMIEKLEKKLVRIQKEIDEKTERLKEIEEKEKVFIARAELKANRKETTSKALSRRERTHLLICKGAALEYRFPETKRMNAEETDAFLEKLNKPQNPAGTDQP